MAQAHRSRTNQRTARGKGRREASADGPAPVQEPFRVVAVVQELRGPPLAPHGQLTKRGKTVVVVHQVEPAPGTQLGSAQVEEGFDAVEVREKVGAQDQVERSVGPHRLGEVAADGDHRVQAGDPGELREVFDPIGTQIHCHHLRCAGKRHLQGVHPIARPGVKDPEAREPLNAQDGCKAVEAVVHSPGENGPRLPEPPVVFGDEARGEPFSGVARG